LCNSIPSREKWFNRGKNIGEFFEKILNMIRIIPAIDLIYGKCVRLSQGDYNKKKIYNEDPLEVAKKFEDFGIQYLHLVDLDGAKEKHVVNSSVLEKIVSNTSLSVDFGGGIKTDEDIKLVFNCGANQATIGSVAITDRDLFCKWLEIYGPDKIILGADIKNGKIAVSGWLDVTDISLNNFLEGYMLKGVKNILCTDISKDGMLQGTALELYIGLHQSFQELNIIASGGIANISEVEELNRHGIYAVIIGKAIYEGKIMLKDLSFALS
jgi:phosphoribosylformimino-5-aminoimidazole carboxamide ribotide isomerase